MRLTTVILIASLMQVSAASLAQKITLSEKNAPLERIFDKIYLQTGFDFVIHASLLRNAKPINIKVESMELKEVLDKIFIDQDLDFEIQEKMVVVRKKVPSFIDKTKDVILNLFQNIDVRGKVLDEKGLPLSGAIIKVKGSGKKAVTNVNGEFNMQGVEENAVLVISFIGYQDRELAAVKEMGVVKLILSTDKLEEVEVISTGYQQIPKERSTGSFIFVDKQTLESRNDNRIMDRLIDYVPGLQYDNRGFTENRRKYTYNIRGFNSLLQTINAPLVIVDDMPYEGDIDLINPADVESVTILKDAAARSIWGASAANGVIVITMKKPQSNSPVQVTFGSSVNYTEKEDLWYRRSLSTSDFIDLELAMFKNGYYDNDLKALNKRTAITSPLVDLLGEHREGKVSDQALETQIAHWRTIDYRDEYNRLIANNPIRQNYNLGFSGGAKWVNYLVSGSYEKSSAKVKFNYDNRYTMRAITELKPTKGLAIELGMMYIGNEIETGAAILNYPMSPQGGKVALYPYAEFQGANGEALTLPYVFNKRFLDTAGNGKLFDWTYRPLEEIGQTLYTRKFDNMNVHLRLKFDFSKYLKAEVRYGLERQAGKTTNLARENSFEMRNLINRWTQINGEHVKYNLPPGGRIQVTDNILNNQLFRGQLSFNRDWNTSHLVNVFLASDISQAKGETASYQGYGYNEDTRTHVMVDYITAHPTFGNLYNNSKIPSFFGFDSSNKRMISFLGNAAYTYKQRYMLNASARRDASNLLGVRTNEKWKPLWSIGLGWSVDKEDFMKRAVFNQLKLRATYGHSGNIVAGNGYYPTLYMQTNAMYSGLPYAGIASPPDPYRKWEDARMINLGIDFGLWNNRLSGSIEYYNKKNTDLIAQDQLDPTSSLISMQRNTGILTGNGWDVILNSSNIRTGNFSWNTNFSFSYVKDIIKKYYGNMGNPRYMIADGGKSSYLMEGYGMYSVFSYRSAGLDPQTGAPRGYDRHTGEISMDYIKLLQDSLQYARYHGPGMAPAYGFLRNTFTYKSMDLSFNVSYKFGGYFREEIYGDNAYGNWSRFGNYADRWQKPGDENHTYIPAFPYPKNGNALAFAAANEDFVHKSDFVRLTDLTLGYKFRISTSHRRILLNASIGARNLGLIWTANKIGVDPDNIYFRQSRSYNIGVNITY